MPLLALIALGALTACSAAEEPSSKVAAPERRIFSAESKRIARLLSIGAEGNALSGSIQYQAGLCTLALGAIKDRMLGGVLSREQERAFVQAQALYERRAASGISAAERDKMMAELEAVYPEQSDRARFAITCLRETA